MGTTCRTNIMSYQGRADQNKNGSYHCKHQNLQLQSYDSKIIIVLSYRDQIWNSLTYLIFMIQLGQAKSWMDLLLRALTILSGVVARIGLSANVMLQLPGCITEKAAHWPNCSLVWPETALSLAALSPSTRTHSNIPRPQGYIAASGGLASGVDE